MRSARIGKLWQLRSCGRLFVRQLTREERWTLRPARLDDPRAYLLNGKRMEDVWEDSGGLVVDAIAVLKV